MCDDFSRRLAPGSGAHVAIVRKSHSAITKFAAPPTFTLPYSHTQSIVPIREGLIEDQERLDEENKNRKSKAIDD
jgi:hypothetical protein